MKELKATTKRAQVYIQGYMCSEDRTLRDCYKSWSTTKEHIFQRDGRYLYISKGARDIKIISHNTQFFSLAGIAHRNTGEWLIVDTPSNFYEICLLKPLLNGKWESRITGEVYDYKPLIRELL